MEHGDTQSDAGKLRRLEEDNVKLKQLLGEAMLEISTLRTGWLVRLGRSRALSPRKTRN